MNLLDHINAKYDIGATELTRITSGITNTCYRADGKRTTFIKIIEQLEPEAFEEELAILQHLHAQNIPVQLPRTNREGTYVTTYGTQSIIAYPYHDDVEDKINSLEDMHIEAIITLVAHLHSIPVAEHLPKKRTKHMRRDKYALFLTHCTDDALTQEVSTAYETHRNAILAADLPVCINHGDVWPGNFLFRNDAIACVIDTEDVEITHRLNDLVIAVLAFGYTDNQLDLEKLAWLLRIYQHVTPLTEDECALLHDYLGYTLAWVVGWRHYDYAIRSLRPEQAASYRFVLERLQDLYTHEPATLRDIAQTEQHAVTDADHPSESRGR